MMDPVYLAVYGSLRRGLLNNAMIARDSSVFLEQGQIKGTLYDLGWYPGLKVEGDTPIVADLYLVKDEQVMHSLNQYEGYTPRSPEKSLFVLKPTGFFISGKDVMCYEYNGKVDGTTPVVEHGDWARHVSERNSRKASGLRQEAYQTPL